jgi:hypothetical protein
MEHWHELAVDYDLAVRLLTEQDKQNTVNSGGWEVSKLNILDENGEKKTDHIVLPGHPSRWVIDALTGVCQAVQQQGGFMVDPVLVMQKTVVACTKVAFDAIDAFLQQQHQASAFSESCWLQLCLDYGFLWQLLQSSFSSQDDQIIRRQIALRDRLKLQIDPINYTLYESNLNANIQRAAQRYYVLFHYVVNDNKMLTSKPASASSFLLENHSTVTMAPPPPRFILLPASYQVPVEKPVMAETTKTEDTKKQNKGNRSDMTSPLPRKLLPKAFPSDLSSSSLTMLGTSIQSKLGRFF